MIRRKAPDKPKLKLKAETKPETKTAAPKPKKKVRQKAEIRLVGLHNLKAPIGSHKTRKIKGRGSGSGHGKTATRGSKGQTSRAGRDFYPGFEGGQTPLIRRIPKRGFSNPFRKEYQIVNIKDLDKIKESIISLEILKAKGLIKSMNRLVKILGDGEIKTAVTIQAHAFSKQALDKIQKAGGKAEVVANA